MNTRKRSASQALLPTREPKRRSDWTPVPAPLKKEDTEVAKVFRWLSNAFSDTFRGTLPSSMSPELEINLVTPPKPKVLPASNRATRPVPPDPKIRAEIFDRPPPAIPSSASTSPDRSQETDSSASPTPFSQLTGDPYRPDPMAPRIPPRQRRRAIVGHAGVKRKPRQHIHADLHRARVVENRQKELYNLKRSQGYSQDYSTFRGYLAYGDRLMTLDAFRPSGSLGHRRAASDGPIPQPPISTFLENAIRKARAALDGPLPPKPFVPSLSRLRLEDEAIERRIRGKKQLPSSLTTDQLEQVHEFLSMPGVIAKAGKEQIGRQDLARLTPGQWLNDEVINMYGAMIVERSEHFQKENQHADSVTTGTNGRHKTGPTFLKVHIFNTFFFAKLEEVGYEKGRLGKWTKKVDIFKKDIVIIPVNLGNSHWTCAAINVRKKRFEYYDSMGMNRPSIHKQLRIYVEKEHLDKKKKPIDLSDWEDIFGSDAPQQENGFDCGVFTCQYMENLSRGIEEFEFSQKDMSFLRNRMIWEMGKSELVPL